MAVFKLPLILIVSWFTLTVMAASETPPGTSFRSQIFYSKTKPTRNIVESMAKDDLPPSFASPPNMPSQLSPLAPQSETPLISAPNPQLYSNNIRPGENIVARLQGEGGGGGSGTMTECWNALMELKACTNEIILFFINGESYMGMDCCRAIRVITHQCWPSMLTSLGYTAEEGDVLKDYCGKSSPQPAPIGLYANLDLN